MPVKTKRILCAECRTYFFDFLEKVEKYEVSVCSRCRRIQREDNKAEITSSIIEGDNRVILMSLIIFEAYLAKLDRVGLWEENLPVVVIPPKPKTLYGRLIEAWRFGKITN